MKKNPLLQLELLGQSIWLDSLSRPMLTSGELKILIAEDGLSGVTSNPAIFEKAIAESTDYDGAIRALALAGKGVEHIYEALVVEDIRIAADQLRQIYDRTDGRDGFISLEVSPHLAHDTRGTLDEARKLWVAVNRPNVFIKVPATAEGLPAIRELISDGMNINITLLFGLSRYRQVVESYVAGLEDRLTRGKPIDHVASVASFFLSRIDVMVDPMLEKRMKAGGRNGQLAEYLHGEVAISCAKAAFRIFKEIFRTASFSNLVRRGGRIQRLLWASTGTKNPAYSDVKYVEPLIGQETINTIPMETLLAYRDHGKPASRLGRGLAKAEEVLKCLPEVGINLDRVTQALEDEGVDKFVKPYDLLMKRLSEKRAAFLRERRKGTVSRN
jgi:transaldolase